MKSYYQQRKHTRFLKICQHALQISNNPILQKFQISDVVISRDFSYATVYITNYHNVHDWKHEINNFIPVLNNCLASSKIFKKIPTIVFKEDNVLQKGNTIDELVRKKPFIEVIAVSIDDVAIINKYRHIINRVELCCEMEKGGYTPPIELCNEFCQKCQVPTRIMLRNCENYQFNQTEFLKITDTLKLLKNCNADGFVIGFLDGNNLCHENLKALVSLSPNCKWTFHRAFNFVDDKYRALRWLGDNGFDTILTSGSDETGIEENINLLRWLNSFETIKILCGGGVSFENMPLLWKNKLTSFHLGKSLRKNNDFAKEIDELKLQKLAKWILNLQN